MVFKTNSLKRCNDLLPYLLFLATIIIQLHLISVFQNIWGKNTANQIRKTRKKE